MLHLSFFFKSIKSDRLFYTYAYMYHMSSFYWRFELFKIWVLETMCTQLCILRTFSYATVKGAVRWNISFNDNAYSISTTNMYGHLVISRRAEALDYIFKSFSEITWEDKLLLERNETVNASKTFRLCSFKSLSYDIFEKKFMFPSL